jgi:nicotinamidase-related amidase
MRQILLMVDVQATFSPPEWLVEGVRELAERIPSVATIELHDETRTPFKSQLGWCPAVADKSLARFSSSTATHRRLPPSNI